MVYHRLSLWVNKMMKKTSDGNPSMFVLSQPANSNTRTCVFELLTFLIVLFAIDSGITVVYDRIQFLVAIPQSCYKPFQKYI
jgi:hypothetical protein